MRYQTAGMGHKYNVMANAKVDLSEPGLLLHKMSSQVPSPRGLKNPGSSSRAWAYAVFSELSPPQTSFPCGVNHEFPYAPKGA